MKKLFFAFLVFFLTGVSFVSAIGYNSFASRNYPSPPEGYYFSSSSANLFGTTFCGNALGSSEYYPLFCNYSGSISEIAFSVLNEFNTFSSTGKIASLSMEGYDYGKGIIVYYTSSGDSLHGISVDIVDDQGNYLVHSTGSLITWNNGSGSSDPLNTRYALVSSVKISTKFVDPVVGSNYLEYYITSINFTLYNIANTSIVALVNYANYNNGLGLYYGRDLYAGGSFKNFGGISIFSGYFSSYYPGTGFSTGSFSDFSDFIMSTGSTSLGTWLGSTSVSNNSSNPSFSGSTGSTNSWGNTYFQECSGITDIICGLKATVSAIYQIFTGMFDGRNIYSFWESIIMGYVDSLTPTSSIFEVSDNFIAPLTEFSVDANGLCHNEARTTNTATALFIVHYEHVDNFMGRFILKFIGIGFDLINKVLVSVRSLFFPITPPMYGEQVCFFNKVFTIQYQKFIPTPIQVHNSYVPDSYNPNTGWTLGEPTLFDYVANLFLGAVSMVLILAAISGFSSTTRDSPAPPHAGTLFMYLFRKGLLLAFIPTVAILITNFIFNGAASEFITFLSNSLVIIPSFFLTYETIAYGFNIIWFFTMAYILALAYGMITN